MSKVYQLLEYEAVQVDVNHKSSNAKDRALVWRHCLGKASLTIVETQKYVEELRRRAFIRIVK